MQSTTIKTVIANPENTQGKKAVKKNGQRIGYYYIIYRSLKKSPKNDVIKCFYIKGLLNFGFCVIKEGTHGDSKDKYGRDITDRLQWQYKLHAELQGKVRVPKLLGSFEEHGNYYLIVEMIRGISLSKFIKSEGKNSGYILDHGGKGARKIINYMIQMVTLLDELHKQHVVHRDVTPANFMIMPNGKLALIDLELSYSIKHQYPTPAFTLGTYGYMSPEQLAVNIPTIREDTFSVGAILLQVFSGVHPLKLTEGGYEDIADRVNFFIADKKLAYIIGKCFDPRCENRPALVALKEELFDYREANIAQRTKSVARRFSKCEVKNCVQSAIEALSTPLFADEKGWFSVNERSPFDSKNRINKARYASLSVGDSGVLYTLCKAINAGFDVSSLHEPIQKAMERIEQKYITRIENATRGLYIGSDGIALALAKCDQAGLFGKIEAGWVEKLLSGECEGYNVSSGISGQGYANLQCIGLVDPISVQNRTIQYVQRLINEQEKDGSWIRLMADQNRRTTKGFSNGVAGIVHFLLVYAAKYNNSTCLETALKGLNWIVRNGRFENGSLEWRSTSNMPLPHNFSEGNPGIAMAFIKAYEVSGINLYKEYATKALHMAQRTMDDNLSQQNGLSGIGEVYLEAAHIFQDSQWLDHADWIVQIIMHMKKRHALHGVYWLVQDEKQPYASFMAGNTGVIHFLLRYLDEKINFPFIGA